MVDYINNMVNEFDNFAPNNTASTPAGPDLLSAGKGPLDQPRTDKFCTFVAKGLFASSVQSLVDSVTNRMGLKPRKTTNNNHSF